MGGKAAAQTILDMRRTGDYSKQSCKVFERRYAPKYLPVDLLSKCMCLRRISLGRRGVNRAKCLMLQRKTCNVTKYSLAAEPCLFLPPK